MSIVSSLQERMEAQVCSKLEDMLDESIEVLEAAKKLIKTPINQLKSLIRAYQRSPQESLNQVRNAINNNTDKFNIPLNTSQAVNQLLDIYERCPIFKDKYPDVISAYRSFNSNIKRTSASLIDTLSNSLSEFPICKLINQLLEYLGMGDLNLQEVVPYIYQIAGCIDAICGSSSDLESKLSRVNSLLTSIYVTPSGNLDKNRLFENLDSDQITALNETQDLYDNTILTSTNALKNGISYAKGLL